MFLMTVINKLKIVDSTYLFKLFYLLNQVVTKIISTLYGAQWLNRDKSITQETKPKPKIHFQAHNPFLTSIPRRLTKDAYARF